MNYNIVQKDISNGIALNQENSLGSGDYLILRYAPDLANVRVRLNDANAPAITMVQNDSILAKGVTRIYIEADAVLGEHIIFAQANTGADFKIIPSPKISTIQTIGQVTDISNVNNFSLALLTALDKLINPFLTQPLITFGNSNSLTTLTVLSQITNATKVKVSLMCTALDAVGAGDGNIYFMINGNIRALAQGYADANGRITNNFYGEFIVNPGDLLQMNSIVGASNYYNYFVLEEYTKR